VFHAVVLVNIAHAARQSGAVIDLDADGHAVRAHLHAVFEGVGEVGHVGLALAFTLQPCRQKPRRCSAGDCRRYR